MSYGVGIAGIEHCLVHPQNGLVDSEGVSFESPLHLGVGEEEVVRSFCDILQKNILDPNIGKDSFVDLVAER